MPGIKIINILRDDTFPEILEVFRQAAAKEVIFVLPKNGKVFRSEDHFAAFASEAAGAEKTVSILSANPNVNAWARKYKFHVMAASKTPKTPPADEESVVETPDETLGSETVSEDEVAMPVEVEAELASVALDGVQPTLPKKVLKVVGRAERPAPVAVERALPAEDDLDYIDAVWRDRATRSEAAAVSVAPLKINRWRDPAKMSKGVAAGILAISLLVLGGVVYATTSSAHIEITPASQDLDLEVPIQASDVFSSVDSNFGKIPGQLMEITKTATKVVAASAQRDVASKSRGKLTVSNEYSSAPQTLIATTRFESAGGLIFRTLQSVTVPGSTVQNGKLVAGKITVDVIADKPGTQYDIAPGKFTLPAFKERGDTDRYGKFTASSTTAFSGGASGPSKVVTQSDYDSAKTAATTDAKDQVQAAFSQQAADLMLLEGVEPKIGEIKASAQPDDAAASISISITGTLKTVAFRKADLEQLLRETVLKKEHLVILPEQLKITYSDIAFKPDLGVLVFTATLKGPGYAPIDQDEISKNVQGQSGDQIREFFHNREGVASATVSLTPFWVRSVPKNPKKIEIRLDYTAGE